MGFKNFFNLRGIIHYFHQRKIQIIWELLTLHAHTITHHELEIKLSKAEVSMKFVIYRFVQIAHYQPLGARVKLRVYAMEEVCYQLT